MKNSLLTPYWLPDAEANPSVMPPSSLVVVVRVNTDCALACRHCGFSRELTRTRRTIDKEQLLQLGARLQAHRQRSNQSLLVSWLGGEPFQWSDWREVTQIYHEQFQIPLSVTTNGLALASLDIRREALHRFQEITISVDGLAPFHDHLRQSPGMHRRLQTIVAALVQEREPGQTRLRVNTVLTRDSIASFPAFCFEMANWGVEEVTFNPLGGNDRPDYFAQQSVTAEQVQRFKEGFADLRLQLAEFGLRLCGTEEYLRRMQAFAQGIPVPVGDCNPGQRFLFVDERGHISPCSFTSDTLGVPIAVFPWESNWSESIQGCKVKLQPRACQDCLATHVFEKFGDKKMCQGASA